MASDMNPATCNLDKRKAAALVALVAVALLCVVVLVYSLMHANPHTDPAIQNTPHTSWMSMPLPPRAVRS